MRAPSSRDAPRLVESRRHMLKPFLRRLSIQNSPARFNILFLGQDEFSCIIFRRLHAAGG